MHLIIILYLNSAQNQRDPDWNSWAGVLEGDMKLTQWQLRQMNNVSIYIFIYDVSMYTYIYVCMMSVYTYIYDVSMLKFLLTFSQYYTFDKI